MAELREVFELVTKQIEPARDSWKEQEDLQRRSARNHKVSALAVVAVIIAAIALFAALNRGKKGSTPAVPPGGSRKAFTVVGLDGSIRSSITTLPEGAMTPALSPDGSTIAFAIEQANGIRMRIATMRLDGTRFRVITSDSIVAWMPRWSPDGRQLLFYRVDSTRIYQLMVMNADGTNVREIPGAQFPDDPPTDWSPDGSLILYTSLGRGQQDVDAVPATGGSSSPLAADAGAREEGGTWSPDGTLIAYRRLDRMALGTMVPTTGHNYEIWLMNADGSGQHRLAALPFANASAPEWSPDGSKIAFIGQRKWSSALYVVDVATGDAKKVVGGLPHAEAGWLPGRATWLPDGSALLVTTNRQ